MFGSVGGGELLFILLLALVFLGPRRIPEIGRMLGKAAGEFRKATAEFRRGVEKEIDLTPVRDATRQIARARQELTDLARAPVRAITAELEAERDAVIEHLKPVPAAPATPDPSAGPDPSAASGPPAPEGGSTPAS